MTWEPETLYDRPYAEQRMDRYFDEPERDTEQPDAEDLMTDDEYREAQWRKRAGR